MRLLVPALMLLLPMSADAYPVYHQEFREYYSHIVTSELKFKPGVPLEPEVVTESSSGFAKARLVRTDGVKIPYEEETAYIEITSKHFSPAYIEVKFFRTIQLSWATDRILVITRDIGHIAGIDEVVDVIDRRWLSQQSISDDGDD